MRRKGENINKQQLVQIEDTNEVKKKLFPNFSLVKSFFANLMSMNINKFQNFMKTKHDFYKVQKFSTSLSHTTTVEFAENHEKSLSFSFCLIPHRYNWMDLRGLTNSNSF